MKISFKRITSSGRFIPEIDGLRFVAVLSIVLYHLNGFIRIKESGIHPSISTHNNVINNVLSRGVLGVPLFFVISGFVLGLPFAKFYILKGEPIKLKKYFLRRITRLEPPYILTMTVLFFGAVFVAKTLAFDEGLKSYFCSIFYIHNFVYPLGVRPLLNGVAWSLEIEVQFYILAPLLAFIFKIKSSLRRRLLLVVITFFFISINQYVQFPFISLVNYIQYFLIGFLLVDIYCLGKAFLPKCRFDFLICFAFFVLIWAFDDSNVNLPADQKIYLISAQLISIFFFYYYVLFHGVFKVLSKNIVTSIGGMCYSIYLIHYPIISLFGNKILKLNFFSFSYANIAIQSLVIVLLVLGISSLFFILIERPCMKKDWYKYVFRRRPLVAIDQN